MELGYQASGGGVDDMARNQILRIQIETGSFFLGFKEERAPRKACSILRAAYLLELREGAFWPKHKTQRGSLAKAGRAS